jgi:hypothetical protein
MVLISYLDINIIVYGNQRKALRVVILLISVYFFIDGGGLNDLFANGCVSKCTMLSSCFPFPQRSTFYNR